MTDELLVPVPPAPGVVETAPKKKGFLKKVFGKKTDDSFTLDDDSTRLNDSVMPPVEPTASVKKEAFEDIDDIPVPSPQATQNSTPTKSASAKASGGKSIAEKNSETKNIESKKDASGSNEQKSSIQKKSNESFTWQEHVDEPKAKPSSNWVTDDAIPLEKPKPSSWTTEGKKPLVSKSKEKLHVKTVSKTPKSQVKKELKKEMRPGVKKKPKDNIDDIEELISKTITDLKKSEQLVASPLSSKNTSEVKAGATQKTTKKSLTKPIKPKTLLANKKTLRKEAKVGTKGGTGLTIKKGVNVATSNNKVPSKEGSPKAIKKSVPSTVTKTTQVSKKSAMTVKPIGQKPVAPPSKKNNASRTLRSGKKLQLPSFQKSITKKTDIKPPTNPAFRNIAKELNSLKSRIQKPDFGKLTLEKEVQAVRMQIEQQKGVVVATPNEQFILDNGTKLASLTDLSNALKSMSQETFKYHVNVEKNDFSAWINGALKDKELAELLGRYLTKADFEEHLNQHIRTHHDPAKKKLLEAKLNQLEAQFKTEQLKKKPEEYFALTEPLVKDLRTLYENAEKVDDFKGYTTVNAVAFKKWVDGLLTQEKGSEDPKQRIEKILDEYVKNAQIKLAQSLKDKEAALQEKQNKAEKLIKEQEKILKQTKEQENKQKSIVKKHDEVIKARKKILADLDAKIKHETKALSHVKQQVLFSKADVARDQKTLDTIQASVKKANAELAAESKKHKQLLVQEKRATKTALLALQKKIKALEREEATIKKRLEKEELRIKRKQDDLTEREHTLNEYDEDLQKRENEVKIAQQEVEETKQQFGRIDEELEEKRRQIEEEGFQKYLQAKMQDIKPTTGGSEVDEELPRARHADYYEIIDTCKADVQSGNLQGAKEKYNRLRAKFESDLRLGKDKETIYNHLRELYDDIRLGELG